jgi:hypothetical protein
LTDAARTGSTAAHAPPTTAPASISLPAAPGLPPLPPLLAERLQRHLRRKARRSSRGSDGSRGVSDQSMGTAAGGGYMAEYSRRTEAEFGQQRDTSQLHDQGCVTRQIPNVSALESASSVYIGLPPVVWRRISSRCQDSHCQAASLAQAESQASLTSCRALLCIAGQQGGGQNQEWQQASWETQGRVVAHQQ